MKKAILALVCLMLASCSFAGMEVKRAGRYHINGYTADPDSTIRAASDAVVNETNAEAYRDAVRAGMAYPYYGGSVGNDYSFYYQGIMPPASGQQQAVQSQGNDQDTKETAEEALRRANDSLRMHKKLRREMSQGEK